MAHATTNKKDTDKSNTGSTIGQMAENVKDKAQDVASNVAGQARDAAGNMMDKARDLASNAGDKAREMGSSALKQADSAAASVGGGMQSLADKIKHTGPSHGVLGSASGAVADTIDSAGRYLQDQGLSGAADDLTKMVRNHPMPAVLLAIGLGFMLARMTRS